MTAAPANLVARLRAMDVKAMLSGEGRGVLRAVMASIGSRLLSAMVTVIAMPTALHILGTARFSVFLLLFGISNWITVGTFGIHSALGGRIARGAEPREIRNLLGAALVYNAFTTALTGLIVGGCFVAWLETVGKTANVPLDEIVLAGTVMIVLTMVQVMLQAFEGVRIGQLKQHALGLSRMVGSVATLVLLLVLPRFYPHLAAFSFALNGGVLIGTLMNVATTLRTVQPAIDHIGESLKQLRSMVASGFSFFLIGLASLFQSQVPLVLLSIVVGTLGIVDYGLLLRMQTFMVTLLLAFSTPLWPAIINARAAGDTAWLRSTAKKSGVLIIGLGAMAGLAIGVGGPIIIKLWTGRQPSSSPWLFVLYGLYFFQLAWSHFWQAYLIGFGKERTVSVVYVLEGVLMLCLGYPLALKFGAVGMIAGQCCGFFLCSNWIFPLMARRATTSMPQG